MRLELRGVRKGYGGVEVLHGVDLTAEGGQVLAIAGANGAGKSTLIKVLAGAAPLDGGTILLDGEPLTLRGPEDAQALGFRTVYQELSLVPQMTVTENVLLGALPTKRGLVDWPAAHARVRALLEEIGFADIDPRARAGKLSVARQQMVEIAKALAVEPRMLVLDEPSAVLAGTDLDRLFDLIRRLRERGVAILYVSHRLAEVMEISDRITVIKDGRVVDTLTPALTSEDEIIALMAGRRLEQIYPDRVPESGKPLLSVRGLSRDGAFDDVSFDLAAGEIVGMFGLVGSGRSEVARCLFGADRQTSGTVELDGAVTRFRTPGDAIGAGIALVTEDRKHSGLVLGMDITDNTTFATMPRISHAGLLNTRRRAANVQDMIERLGINPPRPEMPVRHLSGGNQQKVVLAKWLLTRPRVLILDEPTRGVDMATRVDIYRMIDELTREGVAILLISSDLAEVLGATDRVLVMRGGRLVAEVGSADTTEDEVLAHSVGVAA
ncbi:monosaccharide ABC transporter ATP-binding protein, CUT2 family [Streptosporangium subroseum]|uniref:Monosaccharide ABC transporter ATP-binding protein, CUT2 family n=1 Tax=Streptosporangium subroseum TaxID=106412 RepID=A0A239D249_9ACTN|nr:sugar ABC transporter ATP-binding protein [Streptosporangium subroseum]SNS26289.1 monosaccharide ABC transporter ATP-binding protein, CUT2 family [Streptosporangium subroseum]